MPRITELPALAQATSGDVIPIVDDAGNITKKVTANKVVPDGSVVSNQLANGAVTTAKIGDGQVTPAKLDSATFPAPVTSYVVTDQSTNSATYVDLGTPQSVTLNVPASGRVLVCISAGLYNGTQPKNVSFAMSGANTLSAIDDNSIRSDLATAVTPSLTVPLSGLNPGSTTFTLKFKSNGSGFGQYFSRRISVIPQL